MAVTLAAMAGPAAADCEQFWAALSQVGEAAVAVSGTVALPDGDWCVVQDVVLDTPGDHVPDWHAERLRVKGGFVPWMTSLLVSGTGGTALPDRFEAEVEGLRLVVETGNPQMDYLFRAQSRAGTIDGTLALAWDRAAKVLTLEALTADFPGDNALALSAVVRGVDLGSTGAMQMSATGFAVTGMDLSVVTHGLFEWYLLMPFGAMVLPSEGDMEVAAAGMKAEAAAGMAALPEATFPAGTKAALTAFLAELPNPAGTLTMTLRSEVGVGPARVLGYAMTGVPATLEAAAPVFDGVVIDVGWQHDTAE